jgi:DNA transformation protein
MAQAVLTLAASAKKYDAGFQQAGKRVMLASMRDHLIPASQLSPVLPPADDNPVMTRPRSVFVEFLLEQMQSLGNVEAKAMFGGYDIYREGIMFALVADDVLYLKTDDDNRARFDDRDLPAFQYDKNGKRYSMSYNEAPGEVYDDPDDMLLWANSAIGAARRNAARNKPKRKNPA